MKKSFFLCMLVLGLLVIASCAPQPPTDGAAGELTEEAGNVDEVEQTDKDLNTSELDNLDEELDDLSW